MDRQQIIGLLKAGAIIEQVERGTNTDSYGHWSINGKVVEDFDTELTLHHMASNRELWQQEVERVEYLVRYIYTLPAAASDRSASGE